MSYNCYFNFVLSHLKTYTRTFTCSAAAARETNTIYRMLATQTILQAKLSWKLCSPLLIEGFAGGRMVCMRRSKLLIRESFKKKQNKNCQPLDQCLKTLRQRCPLKKDDYAHLPHFPRKVSQEIQLHHHCLVAWKHYTLVVDLIGRYKVSPFCIKTPY